MRILSVSEMQALESRAHKAGHSYAAMMAQAGRGVADAIWQRYDVLDRSVLVLVGPGNNGGDGLVAAQHLQDGGAWVTAYLARPRDAGDDAVYAEALKHNVTIVQAEDDDAWSELRALVAEADVIIDALLGTGAKPPLRGTIATILEHVQDVITNRRTAKPVLTSMQTPPRVTTAPPWIAAVDGPSGLDFNTGEIDDRALSANLTVTFAMPKLGHVLLPGAGKVGELIVVDIGIPDEISVPGGPHLATPDMIRAWLPRRPLDAHKGTFGKAMIVAGSANYTGAAVLAATGAVRAGTGLVTLALPSMLHAAVVPAIPEATYLLLPHTLGVLNEHAVAVLKEQLAGYDALLIGPGLGNTPETRAFLSNLLNAKGHKRSAGFIKPDGDAGPESDDRLPPLVIDADGLNILSQMDTWAHHLPAGTILTPHPGEMARLTGLSTGEIQSDRLATARAWARTWQQTVVLKGAFTIIATPDREPVILPFANPGLSSAGTGDVLAGAIVALRAQGMDAFEAAVAGAYLHGMAGELATIQWGRAGVAARDVAHALAGAYHRLS